MKNIICKTCGSNQFRETKNAYICSYCKATLAKDTEKKSKRSVLIISLLLIAIFGIYLTNKLLFSVKEDIHILSKKQNHSPVVTIPKEEVNQFQKTNPFADVIVKVEKGSGEKLQQSELEEALLKYYQEEKNKAFYIALSRKGAYAFGVAHQAQSTTEAEKQAKAACEKVRLHKKIQDTCIPYAINDHVSKFLIDTQRP